MGDKYVQQLDDLAMKAYGHSTPPAERQQATSCLQDLQRAESIEGLQHVMERSNSVYTHMAIANILMGIVSERWNDLAHNPSLLHNMQGWLVNFISNRGKSLQKFILTAVINILARIANLGWLTTPEIKELPNEVMKYFINNASDELRYFGLLIFTSLVSEINTACTKMTLSQHRKTVLSFRDAYLLEIFKVAMVTLKSAAGDPSSVVGPVLEQASSLALACLSFDMVGIYVDESSDDVGMLQVPSTWKGVLLDPSTMAVFWSLYAAMPPPEAVKMLKCLVQLASVRRSLFEEEEERQGWLNGLIKGILNVLRTKQGLDHQESHHEFCRLLAVLKPNFQLSEIVNAESYDEWICLTFRFTIETFMAQTGGSSSHYLLSLWSRLVAALQYLKSDKPNRLDEFAPDVVRVYITSRLQGAATGGDDVDLSDQDMLLAQLEALPGLVRLMYDKVGPFLMSLAVPEYNTLKELCSQGSDVQLHDTRLAWLVYIMGCTISHHQSTPLAYLSSDAEEMDGQLTALVLQVAMLVQMRIASLTGHAAMPSIQHLQSAVLYYFNSFRRMHLGHPTSPHSKVYSKIAESTAGAVEDGPGVLRVIIENIITSLKAWGDTPQMVAECVDLLFELSSGLSSSKLAINLDSVKMMLTQHNHPQFSFVDHPGNMKHRMKFYRALANLLFNDISESRFEVFMAPLKERAHQLAALDEGAFRTMDVKRAIIGWLRDVRGVATACTTRRTYGLIFEWLFPFMSQHQNPSPLTHKMCAVYATDNDVMLPLLKLYAEMVFSRTDRIVFDASSPNGILLFKEASAFLKAFGTVKLQQLQGRQGSWGFPATVGTSKELYETVYKPITVCTRILTWSLGGHFCNFGVFALYGDPALDEALDIVVKLVLAVPEEDLVGFPKLGAGYFALLDILFSSHQRALVQLPSTEFMRVVGSIEKGITSVEVPKTAKALAASAIGHLCTYYHNSLGKRSSPAAMQAVSTLQGHFNTDPAVFGRILKALFHMVLFDSSVNQWAISGPLLAMIFVFDNFYCEFKAEVLSSLSGQRQAEMAAEFERLLSGVDSLEIKCRDLFTTENISNFRTAARKLL